MLWNRTHHSPCVPILQGFLDDKTTFDLILTDPPYNIGKDFGNDTDSLPLELYLANMKVTLSMCKDLLSDRGSIVWFCIHKYAGFLQTMLCDLGLHYKRTLIWFYKNGMSRQKKTMVTEYEPILWFTKSEDDFVYNADDMRVPYKTDRVKTPVWKKDSKGVKREWHANPQGALRGDVWQYPVLAGKLYEGERKKEFPCQKPKALIIDMLRAFCPKQDDIYNGCVFDPYMGSGTTAVACETLNKEGHEIKWIGSELESKWVDLANERLKEI